MVYLVLILLVAYCATFCALLWYGWRVEMSRYQETRRASLNLRSLLAESGCNWLDDVPLPRKPSLARYLAGIA